MKANEESQLGEEAGPPGALYLFCDHVIGKHGLVQILNSLLGLLDE